MCFTYTQTYFCHQTLYIPGQSIQSRIGQFFCQRQKKLNTELDSGISKTIELLWFSCMSQKWGTFIKVIKLTYLISQGNFLSFALEIIYLNQDILFLLDQVLFV